MNVPPFRDRVPRDARSSRLQADVLETLADAHNYRLWMADLARCWLGDNVLEVGSGTGDYASEWAHTVNRMTLTESNPSLLEILIARFADSPSINVRHLRLPTTQHGSYSCVLAYNVLEHIYDDVAALASCRRLLRPDGHVVVLVPAFPFAMSKLDRVIGHYRRYTRDSLSSTLRAAWFAPLA